MTRTIVYTAALVAFVAATAMTFISIISPNWVSYTAASSSSGATFSRTIGLHQSCSSVADPPCRRFPSDSECAESGDFCAMWRTVGFLMSFATVAELATLVGFITIMTGGKAKRERGWKILSMLLMVVAVIQFAAMALAAYLFDHDELFLVPGWRLDTPWILCTVSACVSALCALGLAVSAFALPAEDGYIFLSNPSGV